MSPPHSLGDKTNIMDMTSDKSHIPRKIPSKGGYGKKKTGKNS
jgi:hypothetical protein